MATARERMLELSSLQSGNAARDHFLSIVQVAGSVTIYGEIEVALMADLEVEIEPEMSVQIESELEVTIEKEFEVEVCL